MFFTETNKRAVLVCAFILGVGAGRAAADDACDSCEQPDYCTIICTADPVPALTDVCAEYCDAPALARAEAPGRQADACTLSVSSLRDARVSFLNPTMNGYLKTATFPRTNPIGQHRIPRAAPISEIAKTDPSAPTGELARMH